MNSDIKRSSLGWALGIFLGLVCAGVFVYADSITTTFNSGDTLHAADVNAIVNAVNQVQGNAGNGACVTNAGDDAGGMVRVGSVCVDKFLSRLGASVLSGATPTCSTDGKTCSAVAVSTATGTINYQVSFAQAARACANAGKRLLTPGEWVAANAAGALSDVTDGKAEYVSVMASGSGTNPLTVGYIGTNIAGGGAGVPQGFVNIAYNDNTSVFISFRCAR